MTKVYTLKPLLYSVRRPRDTHTKALKELLLKSAPYLASSASSDS